MYGRTMSLLHILWCFKYLLISSYNMVCIYTMAVWHRHLCIGSIRYGRYYWQLWMDREMVLNWPTAPKGGGVFF